MSEGVGDKFQKKTKYRRFKLPLGIPRPNRSSPFKSYPGTKKISLPEPSTAQKEFDRIVSDRRSIRNFSTTPLESDELSYLLWATQGITGRSPVLRASPSAGALHPLETYLCVNRVNDIEPGIYHYDLRNHQMEQLGKKKMLPSLADACLGQGMVVDCGVVFIWSAVFDRTLFKYGQRGYRYVYLDAGHAGHALQLAAEGLDLASCNIGAFYDDEVNEVLELDGENESAVYLCTVGNKK